MKKTAAAIALSLFLNIFRFGAYAEGIYSYTTQTQMTKGVVLKNIQRFYGDYSLNINLVTADLKEEHISLELLKNKNGCDKTDTTLALAQGEGNVVAATNADFFSYYKGSQYFSLGLEIKDGKLLQSHINKDMAAGIFDSNALALSYIDFSASVTAQNGAVLPITHINKPTDYYGALLMYTHDFNSGVSSFIPSGMTVVTVDGGIVTNKGVSMGGTVPIPENGYILIINDSMTPLLDQNMNVGETAVFKASASPSVENAKTAFGGGTLLLKNGEKTPITHKVNGANPRSAIGTNADGTVVYLLTVDGRQQISKGVTLEQLSDICKELGMVNALNFDGGGSTMMVGKTLYNSDLHIINSPSEKRKVINAVGIVSDAAPQSAAGLTAKASQYTLLEGDSTPITVTPFDENLNTPSSVTGEIKWVVSSGSGKIENNVFYSDKKGTVTCDLYYNGTWQTSCVFTVIGKDEVCGIKTPRSMSVKKGSVIQTNSLAEIYNKDGQTAPVNDLSLLSPIYDTSFMKLEKGAITILRDGAGELALSLNNTARTMKFLCSGYDFDAAEYLTNDPLLKSGASTLNILANPETRTFFSRLVYARAVDSFKSRGGDAVFIGGLGVKSLTPSDISATDSAAYSEKTVQNGRLIVLKPEKGTLRTNSQWQKFTAAIENAAEKNIIISINGDLSFSDELENRVFFDYLSDKAKTKNIFAVYYGKENFSYIKNGVHYISLAAASDYTSLSQTLESMKYLSFSLTPDSVSFSFENLYGGMVIQ